VIVITYKRLATNSTPMYTFDDRSSALKRTQRGRCWCGEVDDYDVIMLLAAVEDIFACDTSRSDDQRLIALGVIYQRGLRHCGASIYIAGANNESIQSPQQ